MNPRRLRRYSDEAMYKFSILMYWVSILWLGFWTFGSLVTAIALPLSSTLQLGDWLLGIVIIGSPGVIVFFLTRSAIARHRDTVAQSDQWIAPLPNSPSKAMPAFFQNKIEQIETANRNAGWVYLIQSSTGHYKIGMTKNLENRIDTFNVKLPFEVELIHKILCVDRRETERELHQKFAAKRVNGEWFDLSGTDVAYIKSIKRA